MLEVVQKYSQLPTQLIEPDFGDTDIKAREADKRGEVSRAIGENQERVDWRDEVGEVEGIRCGVFIGSVNSNSNGSCVAADAGSEGSAIDADVVLLNCAVHVATITIHQVSIVTRQLEENPIPTNLLTLKISCIHIEPPTTHHQSLRTVCTHHKRKGRRGSVDENIRVVDQGGEIRLKDQSLILKVLQNPVGNRKNPTGIVEHRGIQHQNGIIWR